MIHIVLLGDSIFDNGFYVPGEDAVIAQLTGLLGNEGRATLLAVDGSVTRQVREQLCLLPADSTHLVVSSGGNDALRDQQQILAAETATELLHTLTVVRKAFAGLYGGLLAALAKTGTPVVVCTIYDLIPGLAEELRTALSVFNDLIVFEASKRGVPVIDLRRICDHVEDYSALSPIEPSSRGGMEIARRIADVVDTHDFAPMHSVIY